MSLCVLYGECTLAQGSGGCVSTHWAELLYLVHCAALSLPQLYFRPRFSSTAAMKSSPAALLCPASCEARRFAASIFVSLQQPHPLLASAASFLSSWACSLICWTAGLQQHTWVCPDFRCVRWLHRFPRRLLAPFGHHLAPLLEHAKEPSEGAVRLEARNFWGGRDCACCSFC